MQTFEIMAVISGKCSDWANIQEIFSLSMEDFEDNLPGNTNIHFYVKSGDIFGIKKETPHWLTAGINNP